MVEYLKFESKCQCDWKFLDLAIFHSSQDRGDQKSQIWVKISMWLSIVWFGQKFNRSQDWGGQKISNLSQNFNTTQNFLIWPNFIISRTRVIKKSQIIIWIKISRWLKISWFNQLSSFTGSGWTKFSNWAKISRRLKISWFGQISSFTEPGWW